MTATRFTRKQIKDAHEYFLPVQGSQALGQEEVGSDENFPPLRDEDVPNILWFGCIAMLITEEGLDGNALVARNQDFILEARKAGFAAGEIAQYAVLKEGEPLR